MTSDTTAPTLWGHPRALATLFMTEMWERLSFYGMRALLVYYLISGGPDGVKAHLHGGGLGMTLAAATAVYSVYSATVYLMTMPGGWVADRLWGPHRTVLVGGVVIMAGHFTLAVPGPAAFFAGLALVTVGTGLLKANVSTMVGHLYDGLYDHRRDSGFTLFYVGINLGAFLAPLLIGTVGELVSWHLGFALSGVGMALGLLQYLLGARRLSPKSRVAARPLSAAQRASALRRTVLGCAVTAAFYLELAQRGWFSLTWVLAPLIVAGLVIPVAVLVRIRRDPTLGSEERSRLRTYTWFFVAAAVFWMIYDQGGSTLAVFAGAHASDTLGGFTFPYSWYQALNPLFIMAFSPLLVAGWTWLARRRREPDANGKFTLGLVLIAVSLLVFVAAMVLAEGGVMISPLWLVIIYAVQTVAELCLSPVGLSVTTRLAPRAYGSQMIGVWFLAVTAGDSVTGLLSLTGVGLNSLGAVSAEAAVALVAAGVFLFRRRLKGLLRSPQPALA
ncbi:peptide MFS transporter [Streptomyces sp. NPDC090021]|uniref:peptide MFS transporter n=1 Tax=Streptomyces sp. NPDC090021 TaxID=3365919 RepID=UPI00382390B9